MSLKPSRKFTPEQRHAMANPKTKVLRVVVEVELEDKTGNTQRLVKDAINRVLQVSRPNFIRSYNVVGYSHVQGHETRDLREVVTSHETPEEAAAAIKQKGAKEPKEPKQ